MSLKTVHLRISGRVQGVYFRASMCNMANQYEIKGWVRNRLDGSVEAMLQGESENVENMITWARIGPVAARVERVEISIGEGIFEIFEAKSTM